MNLIHREMSVELDKGGLDEARDGAEGEAL